GLGVAGDGLRAHGRPLGEPNAQDVDLLDDMVVRHDVAARVDEDAGPHAVDAVLGRGLGEELFGLVALDGAFAVDVDDGAPDTFDDLDDGRVAWVPIPPVKGGVAVERLGPSPAGGGGKSGHGQETE